MTYQSAFRSLSFPAGTLNFSDFEFLSGFELMAAAEIAATALQESPSTRTLNHPARACERCVLPRRLHAAGLNPTPLMRLDAGEPDTDGYHRKYGAVRIGDAIVPKHILRSGGWSVSVRSDWR